MKLFPHRALNEDHVEWGEWRVVTSDSSEVLQDHLKGWDYQQDLNLQVECQLNVTAACQQLQVDAEELVFLATVDCASTSQRFLGSVSPTSAARLRQVESDYEGWERWSGAAGEYYLGFWEEGGTWAVTDAADVVLEESPTRDNALEVLMGIDSGSSESWQTLTCQVAIPRETVAKSLDMSVQFIVTPRLSAEHAPGARVLIGPGKRTHLEGDGARFPTEPVSFNAMKWAPALWKVKFSFDSPDDSFSGAVRLFVNVDHAGASSLLDPQAPGGEVTRAFLRQDIVRVVLSTLAREARGSGSNLVPRERGDADDSVLGVANALAQQWLKLDVDEAVHLLERSPEDFDTRLQAAALDVGKKVFA
ncbi:hypothetical protein ASJ30_05665 [Janibacter indicus]|uniref:Uncharacterized protein n=1 Tax=Janibacter indicus TaxID=857417 RepID=A0A1L3MFK2_9MICO|nr:hypothetical protein [Janibacter indicus]APH01088.1 hypothetical protein ASJ30_05665 [Janibacter indicus]